MESILDTIQVGKKIEFNEDYKFLTKKREFWDISVEQEKEEYLEKVIVKFTCEERSEFDERLKITPVRNYIRPIVDKMVGSIYRQYPNRPFEVTPIGKIMSRDANATGKSFNELMQYLLKDALIEGVAYAMPDSTNVSPGFISVAQQRMMGIRPFIRYIDCENVVNWTDIDGTMTEVVVLFEREEGIFARYYNNNDFLEAQLNDKLVVQSLSDLMPHGYEFLPVQRLVPTEDLEISFVAPLADIQAEIHNYNSLLATEISENVYTRWVITNARIPENADGTQKMTFGTKRITVLESDATLQSMGSDTAQAATIQTAIKDAESALLKAAGLASSTYQQSAVPTSGLSRLVELENWMVLCSQIKNRTEQFENALIYLLTTANGGASDETVYADKFLEPHMNEDILVLRDLISLTIPKVIKSKAIREFANKYYSMTPDELNQFEAELLEAPAQASTSF